MCIDSEISILIVVVSATIALLMIALAFSEAKEEHQCTKDGIED